MPDHTTRQRRRWYQLLHYQLLHTAHRMLAPYPAAAYPAAYPVSTLYTSAQPYYSATENCHFQMQIQLSRNFQNLHSNALPVYEYINIWSFKEVIRVPVEEIFHGRSCSYEYLVQKSTFQEVLHVEEIFYKRLVCV